MITAYRIEDHYAKDYGAHPIRLYPGKLDDYTEIDNALNSDKYRVFYRYNPNLHVIVFVITDESAEYELGTVNFTDAWHHLEVRLKNAYCPDIFLSNELRGTGLAKAIYLSFIRQGVTLVTNGHSAGAKALWDSLARTPGVNEYYVTDRGKRTKDIKTAYRVLTKRKL